MSKKVLVALSGGIDSAVSALLLKEKGYDVSGVNMRLWGGYDENTDVCANSCCSPKDSKDAAEIAALLNVPFYTFRLENEFSNQVVKNFIEAYQSGKTPNPCVQCNNHLKFGLLMKKTSSMGFDYFATGHYASIKKLKNGRYALFPPADEKKDQTYFLYGMSQEHLKKTIFPLAEYQKSEVRKIAEKNNIPIAKKSDSQEICFVPNNDYREFLRKEGVKFQKGNIINEQGEIMGTHDGKENFTVGQRKGLNIAVGHPLYVKTIHENGDIVVVKDRNDLFVKEFFIKNTIFQGFRFEDIPKEGLDILIQVRYNSRPVAAVILPLTELTLKVSALENAGAVTPGQSAVVYHTHEKYVLAGGEISLTA